MSADNKALIFTILAIIGGIVVLGWALKLFFNLFGLIIMAAIIIFAVVVAKKLLGQGR